jgi:peptidoglycan/LPS O-acetylase OafA/YrhL
MMDWALLPVYVFFIISGFVITMTIERVRGSAASFAVSRFSRIFPAYWAAVTLTYMCWIAWPVFPHELGITDLLSNLTMLQPYLLRPHVDGAYWSLCVEFSFYICVVLLLISRLHRHLTAIAAAWLLVSVLYTLVGDAWPYRVALLLSLRHAHFFVAGIGLYLLWKGHRGLREWGLIGACIPAFFAAYSVPFALCLTFVVGVWLLIVFGRMRWIIRKPLLFLGTISYSLYLTHQMLGYQLMAALPNLSPAARVSIAVVFAFSLASIFTFAIEKPALRAIRRMWKESPYAPSAIVVVPSATAAVGPGVSA